MNKLVQLSLLAITFVGSLRASDSVKVSILPVVDSNFYSIKVLRFYVGAFKLTYNGEQVWSEGKHYHLMDFTDSSSMSLRFNVPKNVPFDSLVFQIGVDSTTNVSGVFGGDLDPTLGMYWTWNSGYINFKLEGELDTSEDIHKKFEYHIGGYQSPFKTAQEVTVKASSNNMSIKLDLSSFMKESLSIDKVRVMSPSREAKELSQVLATCFSEQ